VSAEFPRLVQKTEEESILKMSVRAACVAMALLIVGMLPAGARAAQTFYARGGGGNTGAPCTEAEPCNLGKAVKGADDAGSGSVVLLPGPDFTPQTSVIVKGPIDIGGQAGSARPTIFAPSGEGGIAVEDGAHLHDVNVVDDQNSYGALGVQGGASAERITATAVSGIGCFLSSGSIRDSVCAGAVGVTAGALAPSTTAELRNVDAIGAFEGIFAFTPFDTYENRVEVVNSIVLAREPGSHDIVAGDTANEGIVRVDLANSVYVTVETAEAADVVTPPGTAGNITAPPAFVDSADGDFHQLPTSPTIDAGLTEAANGEVDLDGNPRALSAHPSCTSAAGPTDIGAYEYVAPVPTCAPVPGPGDQKAPPPPPPPPGTVLKKAKIDGSKGTATFTFGGTGAVGGFKCELVRPAPKRAKGAKKPKPPKPKFSACKSPKAYKHLAPGHYTFKVEATGPGGTDATPATRGFAIGGGR
jgi:hypothetical protein